MEQESWKKTWKLRCWAEKCFAEPKRPAGIHLLVRDHEGPLEHHTCLSDWCIWIVNECRFIYLFIWNRGSLSVKEEKWYSTAAEVSTVSSLFTPPWFVLFNFASVTCLRVCMESQERRVGEEKKKNTKRECKCLQFVKNEVEVYPFPEGFGLYFSE